MIEITAEEIRRYGVDASDEEIDQVVADAIDQAELVAPGISGLTGQPVRSVAAVIRGAVARFISQGGDRGAASTMDVAGPFTQQSTFQARTTIFLPSEERKLSQAVETGKRQVFAVDLTPAAAIRPCGLCVDICLGECGWQ